MREFQKIQPEQPVPEVPAKSNFQIGPFTVDEACSDDEYFYVDVEGRGTVAIKRTDEGLVVDILSFEVRDEAVASTWANMDHLFPNAEDDDGDDKKVPT